MTTQSILLVDDNQQIRHMVREALDAQGGYTIYDAENGEEAIDILTDNEIDAVILDLEMPVTDGWETLRIIRDQENGWPDTKVIMLTVKKEAENALKAWTLKADYFVSKPFRLSDLTTTLQKALRGD